MAILGILRIAWISCGCAHVCCCLAFFSTGATREHVWMNISAGCRCVACLRYRVPVTDGVGFFDTGPSSFMSRVLGLVSAKLRVLVSVFGIVSTQW